MNVHNMLSHSDTPMCQIWYAYVIEQKRSCPDINSWWKYYFDIETKDQDRAVVTNVCDMYAAHPLMVIDPSDHVKENTCRSYWSDRKICYAPLFLQGAKWMKSQKEKCTQQKDFQSSDKFDNPYLIIPRVTKDNSEHLGALVSGTCFRVLGTLFYLHEHCHYFCQNFLILL